MISFQEYCDIIDKLPAIDIIDSKDKTNAENACNIRHQKYQLLWCAALNDLQEDEAFFETIIN